MFRMMITVIRLQNMHSRQIIYLISKNRHKRINDGEALNPSERFIRIIAQGTVDYGSYHCFKFFNKKSGLICALFYFP